MEVNERQWENGSPPGIAGCSGQLGLAQRALIAMKMGQGREAFRNGSGV